MSGNAVEFEGDGFEGCEGLEDIEGRCAVIL